MSKTLRNSTFEDNDALFEHLARLEDEGELKHEDMELLDKIALEFVDDPAYIHVSCAHKPPDQDEDEVEVLTADEVARRRAVDPSFGDADDRSVPVHLRHPYQSIKSAAKDEDYEDEDDREKPKLTIDEVLRLREKNPSFGFDECQPDYYRVPASMRCSYVCQKPATKQFNQAVFSKTMKQQALAKPDTQKNLKADKSQGSDDMQEVNNTDIEASLKAVQENDPNLKELNLNNMVTISEEQLQEFGLALKGNTHLESFSLANTKMTDKAARAFVKGLKENQTLKSLNIESNRVPWFVVGEVLSAIGRHKSVTEFKCDNQAFPLGSMAEMTIVDILRSNDTILKFGLTIKSPLHKLRVTTHLQKTGEILRQKRKDLSEKSLEAPKVTPKLQQQEIARCKVPNYQEKQKKQEIAMPLELSQKAKENKHTTAIPKELGQKVKETKEDTTIPKETSHEAEQNKQEITLPERRSHKTEEKTQEITLPEERSQKKQENMQETTIPKELRQKAKRIKQETCLPNEPIHEVKKNKYVNATLAALTLLKANDSSMKELKLNPRANISVEMLKELGLALKNNTHVKSVFLNGIKMTDEGAKALAAGLKENKSIKTLDIGSNELTGAGIVALFEAIAVHQSVVDVSAHDQSGTLMDEATQRRIADLIEQNNSIIHFLMPPSLDSREIKREIRSLLRQRRSTL